MFDFKIDIKDVLPRLNLNDFNTLLNRICKWLQVLGSDNFDSPKERGNKDLTRDLILIGEHFVLSFESLSVTSQKDWNIRRYWVLYIQELWIRSNSPVNIIGYNTVRDDANYTRS